MYASQAGPEKGLDFSCPALAEDPLDTLLTLDADLRPDPVDVFEDLLAARLGLARHPVLDQAAWRRTRIAFIEAAGDRADCLGDELVDELLASE